MLGPTINTATKVNEDHLFILLQLTPGTFYTVRVRYIAGFSAFIDKFPKSQIIQSILGRLAHNVIEVAVKR